MKKINAIAWLIMMLMTLVSCPAFAADWGSENVTMQVGETKTLYLPYSITSKTLKSVSFYSASYKEVEVVSYTTSSVKVKALKATSTPVIVRCDYYYYINNGGYTYQNGGAYDFMITVEGETTVKPTKISIPSTSSVKVGGSFYFVPTVTPANATYTLTWESSDNTIASVNQSGMLTGISVGSANITVTTDNGKTATCKVTVSAKSVTSVSVKSTLSLEVGDTYTLTPTVTPSDAETSFTWSSDKSSVATVSQYGVVTAKGTGTANITVKTDNGKTATCKVTVSAKSVTSVSVKSTLSLEVGDTYTLTPTVTPSDAETSFTWSSDKSSVATVSQYGVVTAKGAGTANITVKTDNGKTATCKVTVSAKSVTSVSLKSTLSLEVGDTYTLTPTITPSDAETSFTWSSDKSSVATVSQYGVVTAKGAGTANITVKTDNGKTATCKVTVTAKSVTSVSVKSSLSLEIGDTYTLTPTVTPSDAETSFTWSSDKSSVATVSQYGVVTAKGAGTANITVKTDNGKTTTCKVTVNTPMATEYTVRYHIYDNGKVVYNGATLTDYDSFKVTEGSDVALTIIPDDGYKLDWLWIDYEDVKDQLVNNVLTIRNIRKDMSLTVSFEKTEDPIVVVPVYLNCNVSEGGYITSGNTTLMGENKISVSKGDDVTIKIVANNGYHVEAVILDGVEMMSQLSGNELTIKNMTQDRNLVVRFEKNENQQDEPVVTTENAIVLGNVTANSGTTVAFPISLTNKDEITALQMDLHLPSGITMATDADGDVMIETSSRVSNKHTIDCSKMADGIYRIICYSTKNNTFTGNSGYLFNLMLNIDVNATDGEYVVSATGIELSDNTGTAYTGKDTKGTVTVKSYMLGDVDGNGQHSINDVVCIINHVLNRPNTTFVETAADLDGNGEISVNDAVLLIKTYILGQSSNARQTTRAAAISGENYISIEDLKMQPGEVKTIDVLMTNERDDIRGMQCDITLPSGISFLYDEEAEDYVSASWRIPRKLALSSEKQSENTLRVAGVCTGSSSIYGNSGTIFTFKVKADESIVTGMYKIQLSNVELSYGEAICVADRSSSLEITKNVSGVETFVVERQEQSKVYDLRGQRVDESKAKRGLFIVNGKKVVIK